MYQRSKRMLPRCADVKRALSRGARSSPDSGALQGSSNTGGSFEILAERSEEQRPGLGRQRLALAFDAGVKQPERYGKKPVQCVALTCIEERCGVGGCLG